MSGKVKVWGNVVTVEWADPIEDPDPEVMAKVSINTGVFGLKREGAARAQCVGGPLTGEGVVCEESGQWRHRGDPGEILQPVWKTGAGQEAQGLCFHPL